MHKINDWVSYGSQLHCTVRQLIRTLICIENSATIVQIGHNSEKKENKVKYINEILFARQPEKLIIVWNKDDGKCHTKVSLRQLHH